jgi:hypothetical protein
VTKLDAGDLGGERAEGLERREHVLGGLREAGAVDAHVHLAAAVHAPDAVEGHRGEPEEAGGALERRVGQAGPRPSRL